MRTAFFLALSTVLAAGQAASLTIVNSSFESATEDPGSFIGLTAGSTVIDGWTVDSGDIHYIGTYWVASEGSRSIDINGGQAGAISQALATEVGQEYTILFDMAGNPDGSPIVKSLEVSAGGESRTFTFDVTGHGRGAMGWETKIFRFTAEDQVTTLTFQSLDAGHFGAAIDNVRVPTPSTLGLLALGLAGLARYGRRQL